MVGLRCIRHAFETKNRLVQLRLVRNNGVGFWNIGLTGCAYAYPGVYPSVDFDSSFLHCGRKVAQCFCQRINRICIGNADQGTGTYVFGTGEDSIEWRGIGAPEWLLAFARCSRTFVSLVGLAGILTLPI